MEMRMLVFCLLSLGVVLGNAFRTKIVESEPEARRVNDKKVAMRRTHTTQHIETSAHTFVGHVSKSITDGAAVHGWANATPALVELRQRSSRKPLPVADDGGPMRKRILEQKATAIKSDQKFAELPVTETRVFSAAASLADVSGSLAKLRSRQPSGSVGYVIVFVLGVLISPVVFWLLLRYMSPHSLSLLQHRASDVGGGDEATQESGRVASPSTCASSPDMAKVYTYGFPPRPDTAHMAKQSDREAKEPHFIPSQPALDKKRHSLNQSYVPASPDDESDESDERCVSFSLSTGSEHHTKNHRPYRKQMQTMAPGSEIAVSNNIDGSGITESDGYTASSPAPSRQHKLTQGREIATFSNNIDGSGITQSDGHALCLQHSLTQGSEIDPRHRITTSDSYMASFVADQKPEMDEPEADQPATSESQCAPGG